MKKKIINDCNEDKKVMKKTVMKTKQRQPLASAAWEVFVPKGWTRKKIMKGITTRKT